MELLFFGTSAGAPTKDRNTSAVAFKLAPKKTWHLVDAGEGTLHRIMRSDLSLAKLESIFITHLHGDHIFGLPGILYQLSQDGRRKPFTVVGPKDLETFLKVALPKLRYDIDFVDVLSDKVVYEAHGVKVEPTALSHRLDSFGYRFTETNIRRDLLKDKLIADGIPPDPAWGVIHREADICVMSTKQVITANDYLSPAANPRRIFIAGDNDNPELLAEACAGVDVLVHESTYRHIDLTDERKTFGHSTSKMIAEFAQSINLPNLVMTHFSPKYKLKGLCSVEDMVIEAKAHFKGNVFAANDLDLFTLDKKRNFTLSDPVQEAINHQNPGMSR